MHKKLDFSHMNRCYIYTLCYAQTINRSINRYYLQLLSLLSCIRVFFCSNKLRGVLLYCVSSSSLSLSSYLLNIIPLPFSNLCALY
ncbi:uncharacterized protein Smp_203330 [Schistosoma mansoni]|uniref:Smp_203330 n=1 Tax=Schistosoma mansoni TaxID=6183 RepID=G4VN19_SCHMA|nr:uncharacterized protein Smp_203330 [Schistosoma mansoni]|eukprot:XP_018653654.1 uncharacterized protein Smp_203330 [Schistosoma mansoni]